jgi:transposase
MLRGSTNSSATKSDARQKNPENLTTRQQAKLAWVAKTDPRLHRAYLLKECRLPA